ncbi:MAG TPA: 1,2-phenylacetyl-CoA epoxidase subunit PaaD [Chitinophagaceae bacterium]|jgi:ring-1,2-phenylacetyl-CoA epoxidase subunit PaaD|nr:1,2-phenylacetyl-CoA epoxidase subunit PaaD [Chitinophagaceae bacterium]
MVKEMNTDKQKILSLLEQVPDPEVPVLSVIDLGIVRDVIFFNTPSGAGGIEVIITPTYSGCPAMDIISMQIKMILLEHGFKKVIVTNTLSPAWTTEWMSEAGKEKLRAYGIAPPNAVQSVCDVNLFAEQETVQCPHCKSYRTILISQFGSTACKALYKCNNCLEPFDYFKCH